MAEISVTLKHDGRDAPWIVVRGDSAEDVKAALAQTFNADFGRFSLADAVSEANAIVKGTSLLQSQLGARPVALAEAINAQAAQPAQDATNGGALANAWAQVESAPPAPTLDVAGLIAAATTVDEIKGIWVDHKEAIAKQGLTETWTAKASALKSAA